jgi:hypothetical protein
VSEAKWTVRTEASSSSILDKRKSNAQTSLVTSRVRRILKLVDELKLDASELRVLRAELNEREDCVVDLDGASEQERASLLAIKGRIDPILRGKAKMLTMAEGNAIVREELRQRRHLAGSPSTARSASRTRRVG